MVLNRCDKFISNGVVTQTPSGLGAIDNCSALRCEAARRIQWEEDVNKREGGSLSWAKALVLSLAVCAAGFVLARLSVRPSQTSLNDVTLLPCTSAQSIEILNQGVVYSDGASLRALNGNGRQVWSYVIGANCGFSVGGNHVAGWSNDLLVVLNGSSGDVLFSASLGEAVLSAETGDVYTAALLGEEGDASLVVLDKNGREVDRIDQSDTTVLDYGFFNSGNMLYVLALDTNGTVPMSQITTYRPGRMQAGSITDSEQVIYRVMLDANNVVAVGTTYVRVYDYTGGEVVARRKLVYGWEMLDSEARNANPLMVFAPMAEIGTTTNISDVRMVGGDVDRTARMPFVCFTVAVHEDTVYGFSANHVMTYPVSAASATAYHLPFECNGAVGVTNDGNVVLVSGDSVYLVRLPGS